MKNDIEKKNRNFEKKEKIEIIKNINNINIIKNINNINYNDEIEQSLKPLKIKSEPKGKKINVLKYKEINNNISNNIPKEDRKRSNSIDLYKKQKKDKEKNYKQNKESTKSIKSTKSNNSQSNNNINILANVNKATDNMLNNKMEKSPIKNNNKQKKVTFLKHNFVTIIDVESYKKYNEENTSKDPFDDLQFVKNINNINNININININNNNINNKKNEKEGDENKVRLNCTCFIF